MLRVWTSRRGRRAAGKNGYGQIWLARYGWRFGPMKHPGTWLAIVNGKHARYVAYDTYGFHTFQTRALHTAGLQAAALTRTLPGRSAADAGAIRDNRRFAALVAAALNNAAAQCLFARLVLAGPSHMLRWVTEALDAAVLRRVAGRVIRDLVMVPDQDLPAYFSAWPLV